MTRTTVEISKEKNKRIEKLITNSGGKKKEWVDKIIDKGLLFFETE